MNKNIYILDDDLLFSKSLSHYLVSKGNQDVTIYHTSETLLNDSSIIPDIIILDHFLTSEIGLNVLDLILNRWPNTRVLYLSGQDTVSVAMESVKKGAYAYVEKDKNSYSKIQELIESKEVKGSYLL